METYIEQVEEVVGIQIPDAVLNMGIKVLVTIVCIIVGIQLIKFVRKIVNRGLKKSNADAGVVQFLDSLIKAILYVLLAFMVASNFGVEAASIVAIIGSAGVAIGLALQGSLSNFAGGVLILLLKPFKVGDYIIEDNKGNEGVVTEIQLFYTRLTTPDNRVVILPNGSLANTSLTNVTTTATRRVDIQVGVSYQTNIKEAKAVLQQMLSEEKRLISSMDQVVFVDELTDSCIVLGVRGFVKNEDFWQTKWDLLERTKEVLDQARIEIPYPQVDIHMKEQ